MPACLPACMLPISHRRGQLLLKQVNSFSSLEGKGISSGLEPVYLILLQILMAIVHLSISFFTFFSQKLTNLLLEKKCQNISCPLLSSFPHISSPVPPPSSSSFGKRSKQTSVSPELFTHLFRSINSQIISLQVKFASSASKNRLISVSHGDRLRRLRSPSSYRDRGRLLSVWRARNLSSPRGPGDSTDNRSRATHLVLFFCFSTRQARDGLSRALSRLATLGRCECDFRKATQVIVSLRCCARFCFKGDRMAGKV